MGKKKKNKEKSPNKATSLLSKTFARKMKASDKYLFEKIHRSKSCLAGKEFYQDLVYVEKLNHDGIKQDLGLYCDSIEHQMVVLRDLVSPSQEDLLKRHQLTQYLLDCLYVHHKIVYEGLLFGSSINGLGFVDSDIDIRLRPLKKVGRFSLEPYHQSAEFEENVLKNIAHQTTRCSPTIGAYVPSSKCPIAKLILLSGNLKDPSSLKEGVKLDISLSAVNALGCFNSIWLKFLCKLQPKFHLMATVLKYWKQAHDLGEACRLSSYALMNMLIFFCQSVSPPLLPTVDQMRDMYLAQDVQTKSNLTNSYKSCTRLEWLCLMSLDTTLYAESLNKEWISVLLLKFFEFYLNFDYSSNIITTRTGSPIPKKQFTTCNLYHPGFNIKDFLNIQDPFDLRHNLTSGIEGNHFNHLILTIRLSYERLFKELMNNFIRPNESMLNCKRNGSDSIDWGLNTIFKSISEDEIRKGWLK